MGPATPVSGAVVPAQLTEFMKDTMGDTLSDFYEKVPAGNIADKNTIINTLFTNYVFREFESLEDEKKLLAGLVDAYKIDFVVPSLKILHDLYVNPSFGGIYSISNANNGVNKFRIMMRSAFTVTRNEQAEKIVQIAKENLPAAKAPPKQEVAAAAQPKRPVVEEVKAAPNLEIPAAALGRAPRFDPDNFEPEPKKPVEKTDDQVEEAFQNYFKSDQGTKAYNQLVKTVGDQLDDERAQMLTRYFGGPAYISTVEQFLNWSQKPRYGDPRLLPNPTSVENFFMGYQAVKEAASGKNSMETAHQTFLKSDRSPQAFELLKIALGAKLDPDTLELLKGYYHVPKWNIPNGWSLMRWLEGQPNAEKKSRFSQDPKTFEAFLAEYQAVQKAASGTLSMDAAYNTYLVSGGNPVAFDLLKIAIGARLDAEKMVPILIKSYGAPVHIKNGIGLLEWLEGLGKLKQDPATIEAFLKEYQAVKKEASGASSLDTAYQAYLEKGDFAPKAFRMLMISIGGRLDTEKTVPMMVKFYGAPVSIRKGIELMTWLQGQPDENKNARLSANPATIASFFEEYRAVIPPSA